jgi:hypothetical protein
MSGVHGRAVTGGAFPAAIFSDMMRRALKGVPAKDIPIASPDDLELSRLGAESTSTTTVMETTATTG